MAACLLPAAAAAHISGFTDTSIQVSASGVRIIYTAPRDNLLELQAKPSAGTSAEVGPPEAYLGQVRAGWEVSSGAERCLLAQSGARALDTVASYQFQFTFVCPQGMDALKVSYRLLFERWTEHENYTRVFIGPQRMRMRFTNERQELPLPVAELLARWGQPLAPGFFEADPHRRLAEGMAESPAEATLPRVVEPPPSLGSLALSRMDGGFVRLGIVHIFTGLDHVLFVVGLAMLTPAWRRLLVLVTAFTLAHSVTLALSTMGWVNLDPALAEPLIAGTIIYIGLENLWALRRRRQADDTAEAGSGPRLAGRAALVFLFGLVHGVGFSYTLREMGLREDLLNALVPFNVGVELGQLAILALALPMVMWLRNPSWGGKVSAGLSTAVALSGAAMLVGRL